MGVNYFILDTFKADAGKTDATIWLDMQQKMVDINDAIKEENLNVHMTVTCQLSKASARQRYYTQDNIGQAKNMIDPVSTCLMIRDIFDDEMPNGKNAIKVYRLEGKNGKTKIPVTLDENKHYQVLFIVKNREGSANSFQVVLEHDLSRNLIQEVGITHISMDF